MIRRLKWIDIIKGFSLFCVIVGHSCERLMTGLSVEPSVIKYVDFFTNSFHVTLLFMASGYVYGITNKRESEENYKLFFRKKAIDLLLPYTWFAVLIWVGKFVFSAFVVRTVLFIDLLKMFINPIAYMWFIYVLFFIAIFVRFLEDILKRREIVISVILAVMTFSWVIGKSGNILLDRFLFYALFYYVGALFAYHDNWKNKTILIITGCIFVGFFFPYCNYRDELPIFKIIENGAGAIFFFVLIYMLTKDNTTEKAFSYIGKNTMFFYVIHPVALNAIRMILMKTGVQNQLLWIMMLIGFGTIIPLIYTILANKYAFFDFLFRPRRYIDKRKGN